MEGGGNATFLKSEVPSQFKDAYKEEKKAMEKLTKRLEPSLRNEMLQLWKEYRTKSTPDGRFLSQINVLAVLMQSLLYEKGNRNFSSSPIWEWAFEACDNDACFRFLDGLKKKFNKPFMVYNVIRIQWKRKVRAGPLKSSAVW